jgi:hypothetical protein
MAPASPQWGDALFFDDIYYAYGLLWCMLQVPLSKLKDGFNDGTSIASMG